MCSATDLKRKGYKRMDMVPLDHILALMERLTTDQRIALETRIVDRPGTLRAQMGAWAFSNREAMQEELPARLHADIDRFWKAVDEVCKRNDRKPAKIGKCCRIGAARARRALHG